MDTSKIIKGIVNGRNYTVTSPIVKEDYGLVLQIEGVELPPTYQVDFSNSENNGTSVTMIGNTDGVLIPHQFISTGKDVFAFLYWVGADYGKTVYKFRIPNKLRPDRTDDEPTPEEQSVIDQTIAALNEAVESAQEAQQAIEDMSVSAQTLAEGSSATVTKTESEGVVHLEFGIPKGQTGDSPTITASKTGETTSIYVNGSEVAQIEDGTNGTNGDDGYSPTASVTKSGKVATITITDKNGTTSAQVEDGTDGTDGISPTVTITPITGGHRITITDADGSHSADVMDGTGNVDDVQINGTSIVTDGVANVPIGSENQNGVLRPYSTFGIGAMADGRLATIPADADNIKYANNEYRPVTPLRQHRAVFYGLAKAAGDTTQSQSSNAVGTYTENAKIAIQKMLGIYEAPWELIREDTFTNAEVATHTITTDANGEAFQLTDVLLMFETPKQDTLASRTNYGSTTFYKGTESHTTYNGAYTQEANGAARGTWTLIEKKKFTCFYNIQKLADKHKLFTDKSIVSI